MIAILAINWQVRQTLLRIEQLAVHHHGIIWDDVNRNVFIVWTRDKIDVFVHHAERLSGASLITHHLSSVNY